MEELPIGASSPKASHRASSRPARELQDQDLSLANESPSYVDTCIRDTWEKTNVATMQNLKVGP